MFAVADIVIFAVTLHAQITYTPGPSDPPHSSTSLSIVLGFLVSAGLLFATVVTVLGARQAERNRPRETPRR